MSKISLSGNPSGSGVVTLAAPNTNSTVTLTLPTTAGTVLIQDGTNTTSVVNLTATGTVNVGGGNISPQTGFKNRIINGAMTIDQRNAGAAVTINTAAPFIIDRYNAYSDQANSTGQRSTIAPTGFINSIGITVGTGSSPTAGQISRLEQRVEGLNVFDLGFGTASAQPVTISFWVRSSVTGTHSGVLANGSGNRSYPFTFAISSANTWEYETVTIPGDTSGTWATDNSTGLKLMFNFGTGTTYLGTAGSWAGATLFGATGSVQLTATTGATFYITGVQLEKGTVATPFEFRSIWTELGLCQRYFQRIGNVSYANIGTGFQQATTISLFTIKPDAVLRASPSVSYANLIVTDRTGFDEDVTSISGVATSTDSGYVSVTHAAQGAVRQAIFLTPKNGTTGYLQLSAEL